MKLTVLAAASALILSCPSAAQQTRCQWMGPVWTCDTPQPPPARPGVNWDLLRQQPAPNPLQSFNEGYERGMRQRAEREANDAARARYQADAKAYRDAEWARREDEALGRNAALLVSEGKCEEAEKMALSHGNLRLAADVRNYCALKK